MAMKLTSGVSSSLKSTKLRLVVAWIVLWAAMFKVCAAAPNLSTFVAHSMSGVGAVALIWLGMVFAISMMEAWLKFTAPLLTKAVGVDVGRTVFGALQAVETVHAVALLAFSYLSAEALRAESALLKAGIRTQAAAIEASLRDPLAPMPPMGIATTLSWVLLGITLTQSLLLGPALDRLACHLIASASSADIPPSRLEARDKIAALIKKDGAGRPGGEFHKFYGFLEFIKLLCLLFVGAWGLGFITIAM